MPRIKTSLALCEKKNWHKANYFNINFDSLFVLNLCFLLRLYITPLHHYTHRTSKTTEIVSLVLYYCAD